MSVHIHPLSDMRQIVATLRDQPAPLDVYIWYEGPQGLPEAGATFYKESLLEPMQSNAEARIHLYSLKAWKFERLISQMENSPLSDAVEKCKNVSIQCLCSSLFFKFCAENLTLRDWARAELPKKQWLSDLSAHYKPKGKTVAELFESQPTLLDSIQHLDVSHAYSHMQYVEGFFLIREVVAKALDQNQRSAKIAFVLPNDEDKYYRDLPQDLPGMLRAEFGSKIDGMKVDVSFHFFQYGKTPHERPYLSSRKASTVAHDNVGNYLPPSPTICRSSW